MQDLLFELGRILHTNFNKAIELNPKYGDAFHSSGVLNFRLGKYSEAIADTDRSIELNPQDANSYFWRGLSYQKLGNQSQADINFEHAKEFGSNMAKSYMEFKADMS